MGELGAERHFADRGLGEAGVLRLALFVGLESACMSDVRSANNRISVMIEAEGAVKGTEQPKSCRIS